MKTIIFYNNFHYGDLHISRTFVKDIINKTKLGCIYVHRNLHKNMFLPEHIVDLDLDEGELPDNKLIYVENDIIYINTWLNSNFGNRLYGCTLQALYYNFGIIYNNLGIELEPIEYYIPRIDFDNLSPLKLSPINHFFFTYDYKKYIYIANGVVRSGQSDNTNMVKYIINLAVQFPEHLFITTEDIKHPEIKNIIPASYIIGSVDSKESDLIENAYVSTFCDVIVGRNSGPATFALIPENITSDTKQLIMSCSNIPPFLPNNMYNKNKEIILTTNIIDMFNILKNKL